MLPEKLRSIFRRETESASSGASRPAGGGFPHRRPPKKEVTVTRQSRGLEQFFFNVRDIVGLSILDLAGASQENINFLTNLGHKVYSQDIIRSLDEAFGPDPAEQTNVGRIEYFLRTNFDYPPGTFDGALPVSRRGES